LSTFDIQATMTITAPTPSDARALKFPVSIKGVLICDNRVLLLKNERDEWELPGGKLESGEEPEACVVREIEEETGLVSQVTRLLNAYIYKVGGLVEVLIVAYECRCEGFDGIRVSPEHKEIGLFDVDRLADINLPEGYARTIRLALERPRP
jgi:8-oxo-dGTP pyrophosphatase MutT (NUDIX family)